MKFLTPLFLTAAITSCGGGSTEDDNSEDGSWIIGSGNNETVLRIKSEYITYVDFNDFFELENTIDLHAIVSGDHLYGYDYIYAQENNGDLVRLESVDDLTPSDTGGSFSYTYAGDGTLTDVYYIFSLISSAETRFFDIETTWSVSNDGFITEALTLSTNYTNNVPEDALETRTNYTYERKLISSYETISTEGTSRAEYFYTNGIQDSIFYYDTDGELESVINKYYDKHSRLLANEIIRPGDSTRYTFYFHLMANGTQYLLDISGIDESEISDGYFENVFVRLIEYESADSCGPFHSAETQSQIMYQPTCKLDRELPPTDPSEFDIFF